MFYSLFPWACSVTSVVSNSCSLKDCSLPGSSVPGTLQARILEWLILPSSRWFSPPRDQTHICLCLLHCRWILYPLSHLGSPLFPYLYIYSQFSNHLISAFLLLLTMNKLLFSAKSSPTLWDSINCSTPGVSALHYLLEFAQIHVGFFKWQIHKKLLWENWIF